MAYAPLSDLSDWHLVHPEQDIRGWIVQDSSGVTIGRVDDLLVDTDNQLVESIRLDNGDEYPARNIEIGDKVIHVRGVEILTSETTEPVVRTYTETRVRHADTAETGSTAGTSSADTPLTSATSGTPLMPIPGYDRYAASFRSHYDATYGSSGQGFNLYEPAYRFGYEAGTSERYRGQEYRDVEPELRREYEREHGTGVWDRIKDAVKYAFQRGRENVTA